MLITLLWWALWLGASYQAYRAWGGKAGVGALVGIGILHMVPVLGWIASCGAALYVGYRAENAIDARRQLRG